MLLILAAITLFDWASAGGFVFLFLPPERRGEVTRSRMLWEVFLLCEPQNEQGDLTVLPKGQWLLHPLSPSGSMFLC